MCPVLYSTAGCEASSNDEPIPRTDEMRLSPLNNRSSHAWWFEGTYEDDRDEPAQPEESNHGTHRPTCRNATGSRTF